MKIISLLLFFSLSAKAYDVTLEIGHFEFKENHGSFRLKKKIIKRCKKPRIENNLILYRDCPYQVSKSGSQLKVLNVPGKYHVNMILSQKIKRDEHFYGLGTQYTNFKLNGNKFDLVSQEQGNGRGKQPLSFYQSLIKPGLSGSSSSTYASSPILYSSKKYAYIFNTYAYGLADFRSKKIFKISFLTRSLKILKFRAPSWHALIQKVTAITGRMRPLPDWTQNGAIIGLMGGKKRVQERLKKITRYGTQIAGVWLQDWVGQRSTRIGPRLIWDWQRQVETYPNLELKYPVLGYFNPFLSPLPSGDHRISMYEQAKKNNDLVKVNNRNYAVDNGGFKGYLVDLFNLEARKWIKNIIKNNVIENGFIGWMADFAEAYPLSEMPIDNHHKYIEEWIKLNREVVDEVSPDKLTFFNRASYLKGPKYSTLFWLGDQTSTFDKYDGMYSSLIGLISSGLSGMSFNHSDIGGYVSFCMRPFVCIKRDRELLLRWMELNAFGIVFRTHLGLKPEIAHQIDHDIPTIKAFSKWSKVFKELKEYRKIFLKNASETGVPVIRPLFFEYPDDQNTYQIDNQYMLGTDLLVAPVLKRNAKSRKVYFPKGTWQHYFTKKVIQTSGEFRKVAAPIGLPAVYRKL